MFKMMPKDEGFYDFFERAAANVHESAMLLENFMRDFTEVQERARQFHNREHKGDQFTREVIDKLNRTFITPFDREDIHRLVVSMDDVLDKMDEAVNRMVLYKVTSIFDDAKQLGSILVHATELIRDMMPALRTLKEPQLILNNCLEIRHQEAEADRVAQHGLAKLFELSKDPIEVIKWKDIYADLEIATDCCDDVADIMESIVIRQS